MRAKGWRRLAVFGLAFLAIVLVAWSSGLLVLERGEQSESEGAGLGSEEPTSSGGDGSEAEGEQGSAAAGVSGDLGDMDAPFASNTATSDKDLAATARQLLEEYQQGGDCLLRQAGYLDLLGNVWGCIVEGPGWVDIVVVHEDSGGGSTQHVVRMRASAWEEELAGLGS